MLAFAGMRGIVSLAAALTIPFTTENGQSFPQRNLTLFVTFSAILVRLVGHGLLLPSVVRWLGLVSVQPGIAPCFFRSTARLAAQGSAPLVL
jgi:NhaP-type Na+/H+ or K+/H+ antiporter